MTTPGDNINDNTCLLNSRGKKLFCKYWSKTVDKNTRGLVFIIHGAAEHVGYYDEIANLLTDKNFYVFSHDHEGHGHSEGSRMHITDFNHYVDDVLQHIDKVKVDFPDNTPIFLVGHSMGGLLSFLAGVKRPDFFKGMVLIGPALKAAEGAVSPVKIFFGKLIARVLPELCVSKLDPKWISRDLDHVKRYEEDPLVWHYGLKAKWGLEILKSMEFIEDKFGSVKYPFYIMHGEQDKICSVDGSQTMYDQAKSTDKTIKIYPNLLHQVHHELKEDKEIVLKDLSDWLEQRA